MLEYEPEQSWTQLIQEKIGNDFDNQYLSHFLSKNTKHSPIPTSQMLSLFNTFEIWIPGLWMNRVHKFVSPKNRERQIKLLTDT